VAFRGVTLVTGCIGAVVFYVAGVHLLAYLFGAVAVFDGVVLAVIRTRARNKNHGSG
jgi:uncharacterized membrane protein HdeD (DUF308 family)